MVNETVCLLLNFQFPDSKLQHSWTFVGRKFGIGWTKMSNQPLRGDGRNALKHSMNVGQLYWWLYKTQMLQNTELDKKHYNVLRYFLWTLWFHLSHIISLLDSPATLPISTRVLTGRVAGLSSKSDILWTKVSQMNVPPLHIGGLYVRHMSMCEACVLQVMCFQVKTNIQWIRDGSGIQTLVHVTFAR